MNATGRPRTQVDIVDLSVLIKTASSGIAAVCGVTERGDLGTSKVVGSWPEYQKHFGGLIADNDFPLYCKRALERGTKLRVGRVVHFTDIEDVTTFSGTKATKAVNEAHSEYVLSIPTGTSGNTIATLAVTAGGTSRQLIDTAVPWTTDLATTAAALKTEIESYVGASNVLVTVGSASGGAIPVTVRLLDDNRNTATHTLTTSGTLVVTLTSQTLVTGDAVFTITAKNPGTWANGAIVAISAGSASGYYNIDVTLPSGITESWKNVQIASLDEMASAINARSIYVTVTRGSGNVLPTGYFSATLASGTDDYDDVVAADYVGSSLSMTGFHAFDNFTDFVRVAVPAMANPTIDTALVAYVNTRKDCRSFMRNPLGVSGETAIAYRNGTTPYSHTKHDSWRSSFVYGDLTVVNPLDGVTKDISALADVLGAAGQKDSNSFPWLATAGAESGKIYNALGIAYNLASPARSAEWDSVTEAGINAVVNDPDFGLAYYGNRTLQAVPTLLSKENVAELMLFLQRYLNPIIKREQFNPNDLITWKAIYRKVTPAMDYVVSRRGIFEYLYQGDQELDNINQLDENTVNSPVNVDNGQYIFYLWVKPIVGLEYIGIKVAVTNSSVDLSLVEGPLAA